MSELAQAKIEHEQALGAQREARDLLGELYHPYAIDSGQAQPAKRLAPRFADVWKRVKGLADRTDLPARAREHLAKAQPMTAQLLATLTFFFAKCMAKVEALNLPLDVHEAVIEQLIPAIYLERVASRSTRAEARHRLRALSEQLLAPLRQLAHPLQPLAPDLQIRIEQTASECADLFQRSSSAVEGRNGQLSLFHCLVATASATTSLQRSPLCTTSTSAVPTAPSPPSAFSDVLMYLCSSNSSIGYRCRHHHDNDALLNLSSRSCCQWPLETGGRSYDQGPKLHRSW